MSNNERRKTPHQKCQFNGHIIALYGDPHQGYEVVTHTNEVLYVPSASLALAIYKNTKAALLAGKGVDKRRSRDRSTGTQAQAG